LTSILSRKKQAERRHNPYVDGERVGLCRLMVVEGAAGTSGEGEVWLENMPE
jgi:hypothetical protein